MNERKLTEGGKKGDEGKGKEREKKGKRRKTGKEDGKRRWSRE